MKVKLDTIEVNNSERRRIGSDYLATRQEVRDWCMSFLVDTLDAWGRGGPAPSVDWGKWGSPRETIRRDKAEARRKRR